MLPDVETVWQETYSKLKEAWAEANQNKTDFSRFIEGITYVPKENFSLLLVVNLRLYDDYKMNGQLLISLNMLPNFIAISDIEFCLPFMNSATCEITDKDQIELVEQIFNIYLIPFVRNAIYRGKENNEQVM